MMSRTEWWAEADNAPYEWRTQITMRSGWIGWKVEKTVGGYLVWRHRFLRKERAKELFDDKASIMRWIDRVRQAGL